MFCLLFALKLDGVIKCSYWFVFLPLWFWKVIVIVGAVVGTYVWLRHPHCRTESDSNVQYKAMIIATSLNLLLLLFEFLACDKLENDRSQMLWVLICIPLFCIAIVSIGLCVWALKHGRSFELELFCSVNVLQFIFLALRLDDFVRWRWVIVFIPIWIVMCVALVGVIYAIILAIILYKSSDIVPAQRQASIITAVGYTVTVISLLVFEILLVNKIDGVEDMPYIFVTTPLLIALAILMMMSFCARTGNHWWFGVRKEFCYWLLDVCPLLQEYGNISYKVRSVNALDDVEERRSTASERSSRKTRSTKYYCKKCGRSHPTDDTPRTMLPIMSIELPD